MLYAIISQDNEGSLSLRKQHRPDHLQRLTDLHAAGRLILAGPYPAVDATDPAGAGFTGSLIVAEFSSLEQAQAWAKADPFLCHGVYRHSEVKPFVQVLP